MEPNILLLGRNLDTLAVLKEELVKFDRNVICANSVELITSHLANEKIDLILVGAGLPDETKNSMLELVKKIAPEVELHIMERTPGINPTSMIGYTNEKAVMWKILTARAAAKK